MVRYLVASGSSLKGRSMLRSSVCFLAFFLALSVAGSVAIAAAATPLEPGENQGTADSFVGTQDWTVNARPGSILLTIMEGQVPPNALPGSPFHVVLHVTPSAQKSHLRFKAVPGGYVFSGSVTAPTHFTLSIIPPASALVREAMSYVITSSGSLAYGAAAGGDPIVGTYSATTQGVGAVKFLPGGRLITTNGDTGTWSLFDAGTHVYVVTLGQSRWTVKSAPGQGLIDTLNGNILFQTIH
jgi:hypothetical protein